jgi:hypothetical protein
MLMSPWRLAVAGERDLSPFIANGTLSPSEGEVQD